LSPEHGGNGGERDARLLVRGLARSEALEREPREEEGPRDPITGGLDELPELHRQREGEQRDCERRVRLGRKRPEVSGEQGDGEDESGEVRSAASREARRLRRCGPGGGELTRLPGRALPAVGAGAGER